MERRLRPRIWWSLLMMAMVVGCAGTDPADQRAESGPEPTAAPIDAVGGVDTVELPEPAEVPGMPGLVEAVVEPVDSPSSATCRGYRFPVTTDATSGATGQVYGEVCSRVELDADVPVLVLLHGGTYDHTYWDVPYESDTFSFVEAATSEGFITVNLDRLGYGRSDHPDPGVLDLDLSASTVHDVVGYLRGGALGVELETVVLNGHSLGGLVAKQEAADYDDVDAVVVSGVSDEPPPADGAGPGAEALAAPFHPAADDDHFADEALDPGYLTTRPGQRPFLFLRAGTYDPAMDALEEDVLKSTVAIAELAALATPPDPTDSTGEIDEPILHALGRYDAVACPPTADCTEALPDLSDYLIVEESGHSINLSNDAPQFYQGVFTWLAEQGLAPAAS